jgi:hypothetical protein
MEKRDIGEEQERVIPKDMLFIEEIESEKDKISEAKRLIESSKELVSEVDTAVQECKVGVSNAANEFDRQKYIFINQIFRKSESLLKKVGIEYREGGRVERSFELSVDTNTGDIEIEHITSGRFTGMLLAIFFAMMTLATWIYFALKALNLPLEKSSLNTLFIETHVDAILQWIGGGVIGVEGDPTIGGLILGFSVLIVAWIVYAMRVNLKTDKNFRLAKKSYIESRAYSSSKDACRKEMLKVDAHLRDVIISIENFTIMLGEENAILQRVVYVEGVFDEDKRYHPSSKKVMRDTEKLMKSIDALLNTSITADGKLNPQSEKVLAIAKAVYAEFIARIYD